GGVEGPQVRAGLIDGAEHAVHVEFDFGDAHVVGGVDGDVDGAGELRVVRRGGELNRRRGGVAGDGPRDELVEIKGAGVAGGPGHARQAGAGQGGVGDED